MADTPLSSAHNPRVRAAAALRDRRAREAAQLTLIDGARELARAIAGGAVVVEVFVDRARMTEDGARAAEAATHDGALLVDVSGAAIDRLAYGDRNDGLVAVARIPPTTLGEIALPGDALVVVLERIEKPGNLGAVLRSADGAGANAVIVADPRTDLFNPNAIRASQGTVFGVPIAAATSPTVLTWLRERGLHIVAARTDATTSYTDADLRGGLALVLGSEAEGLSDAWRAADIRSIRLPMHGVADSLNVSITAAVLLYEARRQRDDERAGQAD